MARPAPSATTSRSVPAAAPRYSPGAKPGSTATATGSGWPSGPRGSRTEISTRSALALAVIRPAPLELTAQARPAAAANRSSPGATT